MKAVVVHESLFGNTAAVAEAIASGLRSSYDVTVERACDATAEELSTADLVVVGAPTQAHGLPSIGTRRSAMQKEQLPSEYAAPGVRELLGQLTVPAGHIAAAFDTRLGWPLTLSGAASKSIAKRLREDGFTVVVPPESFVVTGTKGPLRDGELQRASAWGEQLAHTAAGGRPAAA